LISPLRRRDSATEDLPRRIGLKLVAALVTARTLALGAASE